MTSDAYYVCSGFGKLSQWYQNLQAHPDVSIQVGGRKLNVHAELLPPEECGDEMIRYVEAHPNLAKNLMQIVGYEVPETKEEYRSLAEKSLPFVRFVSR
jgi:deazaflavin-dependent oxidoreductase (nitroreductase family)